jgi:outer membrane murein-binding lipoprotein Lpp
MRILGGILLGSMLLSTGSAFAEDDASELKALKARLKQLEQKMEVQARKEEGGLNELVATEFAVCAAPSKSNSP